MTITLVGAEGNHTASDRDVTWVLGPPAAATGLWGRGSVTLSVTKVGVTSDPILPSTSQQVHGQWASAYVWAPLEVRGFKKLSVAIADTNLQRNITQASLMSLVFLMMAR